MIEVVVIVVLALALVVICAMHLIRRAEQETHIRNLELFVAENGGIGQFEEWRRRRSRPKIDLLGHYIG